MYLISPYSIYTAVTYWVSRKDDKNCIKKNGMYMSGKLNSGISKTLSIKKAKALAKKMEVSLNEIIMGLVSRSLKWHFVKHNDDTKEISVAVPFTFNDVPRDPAEYKYKNNFISITIYMCLEDNYELAV